MLSEERTGDCGVESFCRCFFKILNPLMGCCRESSLGSYERVRRREQEGKERE